MMAKNTRSAIPVVLLAALSTSTCTPYSDGVEPPQRVLTLIVHEHGRAHPTKGRFQESCPVAASPIAGPAQCTYPLIKDSETDLVAEPNSGYELDGWTGDEGCAATHLIMDSNKTCEVHFKLEPAVYTIIVAVP